MSLKRADIVRYNPHAPNAESTTGKILGFVRGYAEVDSEAYGSPQLLQRSRLEKVEEKSQRT